MAIFAWRTMNAVRKMESHEFKYYLHSIFRQLTKEVRFYFELNIWDNVARQTYPYCFDEQQRNMQGHVYVGVAPLHYFFIFVH